MSVSIHGTGTITGIDQGIQISGVSTFINSVSIGGTLTYEDVTNIDSIGIITARSGIIGDLTGNVTGNVTGDITGNIGGTTTIAGISSSIADTAVAVFVYDTSKDSDGGAWRKRTQHTSWYNETLNTATRGSRKEFPAVAVIVAESTQLTIYDGDDPDMPMWMMFDGGSYADFIYGLGNGPVTGIQMLNAKLCVAINDPSNQGGLDIVDFISDTGHYINESVGGPYRSKGNIKTRNDGLNLLVDQSFYSPIVSRYANDVAMTVLPSAPIDNITGLPVPTIAVATDGGYSIIKGDGTVVDGISSQSNHDKVEKITFTDNNQVAYIGFDYNLQERARFIRVDDLISADTTITTNIDQSQNSNALYGNSSGGISGDVLKLNIPSTNYGGESFIEGKDGNIMFGNVQNLFLINENVESPSSGMHAGIAKDFNTGWMHGDIKGSFLSSTDTTDLVQGDILGGNGTFDDASYWTVGSSWTVSGGVATSDSSGISYLTKNGILTAENRYVIKLTISSYSAGTLYVYCGTGAPGTKNYYFDLSSNGNHTMILDAYNTNFGLYGANFGGVVDNLTISSVVDEDHSLNVRDLGVIGTVARNPVATGADLVAYGPFTTTDHLRQPYHPDYSHMQIGTGDAYEMIWYKTNNTSPYMMLMSYEGAAYGTTDYGKPFNIRMESGQITAYASHNSFSSYDDVQHSSSTNDGYWHCAAWVRRGQVFELYVDGTLVGTDSGNVGSNALSDTNSELVIGGRKRGLAPGTCEEPFFGSLALARIGKSAPTAEQVKKMYNDEKHLFEENAKATLYGSSDAVTALAYDDYTNVLHVGTSSGRSDFQRLCRINNTTTAVTTAISASDDLIVEQ